MSWKELWNLENHHIAYHIAERAKMDKSDSNVKYCAQIVASLIQTKTTEKEEYLDELRPYFETCGCKFRYCRFFV